MLRGFERSELIAVPVRSMLSRVLIRGFQFHFVVQLVRQFQGCDVQPHIVNGGLTGSFLDKACDVLFTVRIVISTVEPELVVTNRSVEVEREIVITREVVAGGGKTFFQQFLADVVALEAAVFPNNVSVRVEVISTRL